MGEHLPISFLSCRCTASQEAILLIPQTDSFQSSSQSYKRNTAKPVSPSEKSLVPSTHVPSSSESSEHECLFRIDKLTNRHVHVDQQYLSQKSPALAISTETTFSQRQKDKNPISSISRLISPEPLAAYSYWLKYPFSTTRRQRASKGIGVAPRKRHVSHSICIQISSVFELWASAPRIFKCPPSVHSILHRVI